MVDVKSKVATLEIIKLIYDTVSSSLSSHFSNCNNPHSVTKKQIGLDHVDNTSDNDKPLSKAQSAAIDSVINELRMHEETDVFNIANDAITTEKIVDGAITNEKMADSVIDTGKIADNAVTTAKIEDSSVTKNKLSYGSTYSAMTANLTIAGWFDGHQIANVDGVTADNVVIVSPSPINLDDYAWANVKCVSQDDGVLTFECDNIPTSELIVNILIPV